MDAIEATVLVIVVSAAAIVVLEIAFRDPAAFGEIARDTAGFARRKLPRFGVREEHAMARRLGYLAAGAAAGLLALAMPAPRPVDGDIVIAAKGVHARIAAGGRFAQ